jgi:hypothetical protein
MARDNGTSDCAAAAAAIIDADTHLDELAAATIVCNDTLLYAMVIMIPSAVSEVAAGRSEWYIRERPVLAVSGIRWKTMPDTRHFITFYYMAR